jgi:hypothetical protein
MEFFLHVTPNIVTYSVKMFLRNLIVVAATLSSCSLHSGCKKTTESIQDGAENLREGIQEVVKPEGAQVQQQENQPNVAKHV